MKDEINDPIEKSFRVKFFRNAVLFICQLEQGGGGGGGGRGGGGEGEGVFERGRRDGSKSFGRFHYVCRGVLVAMVVGVA